MVASRILVDVAHMRRDALDETFALLDDLDKAMPVIASHAGYRFGKQEYMLDSTTLERIAKRGGVVGLIMAHHQLNDGIRKDNTENLEASFETIRRHIDQIHSVTGSNDHVALGTDLDGFIKPTREYPHDWEAITSGNAVSVPSGAPDYAA